MPGIVLCELLSAAPFGTLKGGELMAPPTLLTKALQFPSTHKHLLLDVYFTDVATLVVCTQA